MERVIKTERVPIKLWLSDLEDGALQQARNIANLPIAFSHVAIMPDSHQGYGMPIGGVLAAENAIVPNAVGVDIGCGMCSLRTSLTEVPADSLIKIFYQARKRIPVGFKHHENRQPAEWMPEPEGQLPVVESEYQRALHQVGTLGGGNHFIEIQKGSDGYIWLMIHSGSRNIGYTVARFYNEKAKKMNEIWFSDFQKDLAWFPEDSEEYHQYKAEMNFCIEFAFSNRKLMMERLKECVADLYPDVEFSGFINKPHNFAADEIHYGEKVVVHRKGATRAKMGEQGMIPGSQGSPSYIVRGKGNPDSFESCSHGAGRVMSRNEARKSLDLQDVKSKLEGKGILHAVRGKSDLDEAPDSYKDIKMVMKLQADLVEIETELHPLGVIKG
jgi:tRNA-splicing ligase RtcB (3'-phosphate/5'-hydroxy nucleic acid ligase)